MPWHKNGFLSLPFCGSANIFTGVAGLFLDFGRLTKKIKNPTENRLIFNSNVIYSKHH
jgi:hypothetical protein